MSDNIAIGAICNLRHGLIVTRVVGVVFIAFGARSIADAASELRRG